MTTPTETPTPLTDAEEITIWGRQKVVPSKLARTLERQLTAATAQLEEARRDKERLDWLAENQRVNYGLSVGGYFYKSDLRWQENRIRQAIDAAMQQKEGK